VSGSASAARKQQSAAEQAWACAAWTWAGAPARRRGGLSLTALSNGSRQRLSLTALSTGSLTHLRPAEEGAHAVARVVDVVLQRAVRESR
jgi:hypothetical protein